MLESQRLLGVKVTLICLVVREFLFPSSLRHRIENYCILFYFVLFYFILFYLCPEICNFQLICYTTTLIVFKGHTAYKYILR
jgi:hypothetical protein